MADEGKLSQGEKQRIADWLNRKGVRNCSVCSANQWTIADHLVAPNTFHGGGLVLGGASYPQAMLICGNCSNTLYFNAVMMGILPREERTADQPKALSNG